MLRGTILLIGLPKAMAAGTKCGGVCPSRPGR